MPHICSSLPHPLLVRIAVSLCFVLFCSYHAERWYIIALFLSPWCGRGRVEDAFTSWTHSTTSQWCWLCRCIALLLFALLFLVPLLLLFCDILSSQIPTHFSLSLSGTHKFLSLSRSFLPFLPWALYDVLVFVCSSSSWHRLLWCCLGCMPRLALAILSLPLLSAAHVNTGIHQDNVFSSSLSSSSSSSSTSSFHLLVTKKRCTMLRRHSLHHRFCQLLISTTSILQAVFPFPCTWGSSLMCLFSLLLFFVCFFCCVVKERY